jgi:S-adenosylmethionine-diacylgycerolhomoserine-N-methlytransferase
MFGHERRFDTIFFAYSLSMMPAWEQALGKALANLAPGGVILVVDVWDRRDLPATLASGLARWLARQGVVHRPEIHSCLEALGRSGRADVRVEAVARRYAYLATIRTPAT